VASTQTYRLKFRSADGRTTAFDHQRVLRVGRGQDNDIVLDSPSISRRHAELRPTDGGWDLNDVGSTGGTWINGQRVANAPLAATTTARFGAQSDGVEATFTVDLPDTSTTGALGDQKTEQKTVLLRDQQPTYIDGDDPERPGRPARGLLIRTRDGDKRVDADTAARIGRDVRSDIVADDPAVSREHANVERRKDGWWFVDHSNSGSYVDGEPVKEKRITEQTVVQLGHPTAGYQITLVPVVNVASAQKAIAGKRRRRRFVRVTAAAAVLAVVAGGVAASVWLTDRHATEQNALSAANLERAKRASVQIVAFGADGVPESTGSGTIISSDGLIPTNAHVAKPTAKGLATPGSPDHDAAFYQVALAKDDNTPAAPKYRATTIVSDGYLDLAVVKIDGNADGTPLSGPLTLPEPVPVGDSTPCRPAIASPRSGIRR
jgi:putative serine protease PepD